MNGQVLRVGIFVFDEVEVLDFTGPLEVFFTASRVHARQHGRPLFEVFTVAESKLVKARTGLLLQPDFCFGHHPKIDVLIVPGGVVEAELEKEAVLAWLARGCASSSLTASVCTGAFFLAKLGLLDGLRATTHWEDCDDLERQFGQITVLRDVPWVDEGKWVTSAGISAGLDMSLHLVSRLHSLGLAERTARQMQFDWRH